MAGSRAVARRHAIGAVVIGMGLVSALAVRPAAADVMAVKGSATGYAAFIGMGGGVPTTQGPAPTVKLPATGSASPLVGSASSGSVQYGSSVLFRSGALRVSTQGTPDGSVSSAATVAAIGAGPVRTIGATSSCTASRGGSKGSGSVASGTVVTRTDPRTGAPVSTVGVPANPGANFAVEGTLDHAGARFRAVFNEQVVHADRSITVNAVHVHLLGPNAVGDLVIGQSVCGLRSVTSATTAPPGVLPARSAPAAPVASDAAAVAAAEPAQTTADVAAAPESTTTTEAPATTTTTVAGDAVLVAGTQTTGASGGAFGYVTSLSLFGGPATPKGPAPNVELPSGGSASPITGSDAEALAQYGPATIFSSGRLEVSTQGTADSGSVTSSAKVENVNKSGQEVFTAATLSSTCTASGSGATGSTTLSGARVIVSEVNPDIDTDDIVVQIPDNPAPNTSYEGKIEAVGDSFRLVVNEQQQSGGSITVNGAHMYLLGPVAVGELTIGQSRCSLTGATTSTTSGGRGDGGSGDRFGGSSGGSSTTGGVATTGVDSAPLLAVALDLVVLGVMATRWAGRRREARPHPEPGPVP